MQHKPKIQSMCRIKARLQYRPCKADVIWSFLYTFGKPCTNCGCLNKTMHHGYCMVKKMAAAVGSKQKTDVRYSAIWTRVSTVLSPHVARGRTKVVVAVVLFFIALTHLGDWPQIGSFEWPTSPHHKIHKSINWKRSSRIVHAALYLNVMACEKNRRTPAVQNRDSRKAVACASLLAGNLHWKMQKRKQGKRSKDGSKRKEKQSREWSKRRKKIVNKYCQAFSSESPKQM